MSRTRWTIFMSGLAWLLAGPAVYAQEKPNIVFILVDDWRWNVLGCMGDPVVKTPHIDALARQGVLFRNAFVTTSICAVSRASILTGQWQRRHGVDNFVKGLNGQAWAQTYVALLRAAGYRTGFIGKFGVGSPQEVKAKAGSFDFWRGLPGQAGTFFIDKDDPKRIHRTAKFGDQALEFLEGCKAGTPFCLSISFNAVHARDGQEREFEPDPRDEELYADTMMPVPKLATAAAFERLPEFVRKSEGRKRWQKRFATPEMFQKTLRDYYRLCSGVDREVGRIRETLAKLGLANNTVIVFFGDNGFFLGDRGMADKWLMYEESIRVPAIFFDPRLPADKRGRSELAMVLNVDVAPTLLDLADVRAPKNMQGRSLLGLVRQTKAKAWRTEFYYEHTGAKTLPLSEGVRHVRWAYLRWLGTEPALEELYDLMADPLEENNLASTAEHSGVLAEMRAKWQRWRQDLK